MNNTQSKSVSASATKSKKSQRKRSEKSKNQIEFVKIPKQDLIWAQQQNPSVVKLWMKCWECDPYGSRWMTLNHSLSKASFFRAKKIISDKGLFIFKSDRSFLNGRETVGWQVQNLHGARRKNFGLELDNTTDNTTDNTNNTTDNTDVKSESHQGDRQTHQGDRQTHQGDRQSHHRDSMASETTQNQPIPAPSITPQQHLTNSSKELVMVLSGEEEKDKHLDLDKKNNKSSDRSSTPLESIAEGETQNENQVQSLHSFHCVTVVPDCLKKEEEAKAKSVEEQKSMGAACPQTPRGQKGKEINTTSNEEILNQEYIHNPQSQETVVRAVNQNLAIEDQRTTKEYQNTSKEAFARIRAIFDEKKKQNQAKREANLRGDSPMSLSERQAFEQYKREVEANRKKQAEEELVDFWDF